MIEAFEFSIFDVTHWNANVALELGGTIGAEKDYYILFNPSAGDDNPPSDLGGIDRLQYTDYAELAAEVGRLMRQQFGPTTEEQQQGDEPGAQSVAQLAVLKEQIPGIVRNDPGMPMGSIASALGVPMGYAQNLVRPLVGESLRTEGQRKGMRYYVIED